MNDKSTESTKTTEPEKTKAETMEEKLKSGEYLYKFEL